MKTSVMILERKVLVECSGRAERQMNALDEPLIVEMELYFSCLIRKAVRFGADARAENFTAATPKLKIGFRPVVALACNANAFDCEQPLTDFSIVKPQACVPKRLTIDYKNGIWVGDFFLVA